MPQTATDRTDSRRRGRIVAVAALIVMIFGGVALWLRPTSRLRADRFVEIRAGMTRTQVEGLLGGAAGDFGEFVGGFQEDGDGSVTQVFSDPKAGPSRSEVWEDDRNRLFVFFNDGGKVVAASRANSVRRSPRDGVMAKIKWRLRTMLSR